jgi:hypothetical protein
MVAWLLYGSDIVQSVSPRRLIFLIRELNGTAVLVGFARKA